MAFCSLSTELVKSGSTKIDNLFFYEYMPALKDGTIKVYLYGLYLCQSGAKDYTLSDMAQKLELSETEVLEHFRALEDLGLVEILSEDPAEVRYLPVPERTRQSRVSAGKYAEFSRALQSLLPSRMISVTEYRAYFSLMESRNLKPDALLMIIRYCADKKGESISYRYIEAVANDFASRGILTADAVENELSDYFGKSDAIEAVLKKLGLRRKADFSDLKLYEKWTNDYGFLPETVLFVAGKLKRGDLQKLDALFMELFGAKAFTKKEISAVFDRREELEFFAKEVCRNLSVHVEVVDPVVSNYCAPWLSMGFEKEAVLSLAGYCFRKNRRTLEALDDLLKKLYEKGVVSTTAIVKELEESRRTERALADILTAAGLERKPTVWDKESYDVWTEKWHFSEEMILLAARLSAGKERPLSYVNAILSAWKSAGIYTPEAAEKERAERKAQQEKRAGQSRTPSSHSASATFDGYAQRTYSKEELDSIFSSYDDDGLL